MNEPKQKKRWVWIVLILAAIVATVVGVAITILRVGAGADLCPNAMDCDNYANHGPKPTQLKPYSEK